MILLILRILNGLLQPFTAMVRKFPGVNYVNNKIEDLRNETNKRVDSAKETAIRSGILLLIIGVIVWLAVFMYVVFYYTYIPPLTHNRPVHLQFKKPLHNLTFFNYNYNSPLTHNRPVHLQFKTCDNPESTICSFPSAHVELTKHKLLMVGQSYKIYLQLEMPESEANKQLGMFMVCLEMNDKNSVLVANSCRPVMLHYRSWLLHTIKTIVFAPFLVFGTSEEKQQVSVEMFSDFEEDQNRPITDLYIEIQTKKIEVYSAALRIHAHFTGLRYIMFHWPVLSAVVGIGANLLLIIFVGLLSWYQLFHGRGSSSRVTRSFRDKFTEKKDKSDKKEEKDMKNDILKVDELDDEEIDTTGQL